MSLIEQGAFSTSNGLTDTRDADSILFGIKERPLLYFENGGPPVETDYKVLLNEKTNEPLYLGKSYSPIHNRDIMSAVGDFKQLQLSRIRNYYGKRFEFTFIMPDTKFQLGPEETLFSLNIMNSYDGSSSLHVVGGLYVLVCSNGAKVGRLTYQFKRRHTSEIGRNELSGFVADSIEYISERTEKLSLKSWSDDKVIVREQFQQLIKVFPTRKDNALHSTIAALDSEYQKMETKYSDQKEFALFMAVTNMTTRPNQYGLSPTYTKQLDNLVGEVFFN